MKIIGKIVETLLDTESKKATFYFSSTFVIKATRKHLDKRDSITEILLTIGKPNYAERDFIKKCKKAGEPFPVKMIQLKAFKK